MADSCRWRARRKRAQDVSDDEIVALDLADGFVMVWQLWLVEDELCTQRSIHSSPEGAGEVLVTVLES